MPFTLPPAKLDNLNEKLPEMDLIQNNEIKEDKEVDPFEVFKFKDVFNLPLNIIIQNIANVILLVIEDLFEPKNYTSPKIFLRIFLVENRLVYLGLFVIFLSMFLALFFPAMFNKHSS